VPLLLAWQGTPSTGLRRLIDHVAGRTMFTAS
jgi:hypothetical protein